MLFNSYVFIFLYLPVVLLGFFWLSRASQAFAAGWLTLASLVFYGYWNLAYVGLLLSSIVCNYTFGLWITKAGLQHNEKRKKQLLSIAIIINLLLLAYYKYANFFIGNLNSVAGTQWDLGYIILPLGISFFTFTQITFLVDAYQGKVKEPNIVHYTLFVTYFPHLIAGPLFHHKQMMPQFLASNTYRVHWENIAVGLTIFILGLAKKVLVADPLGEFATPIFNAVGAGGHPMLFEAWIGALAYTLQLYFDFSGYTDMAIGLSLMFSIRLPMNFNSPYKSTSIIEFWRRWHMTLSRFLFDYLYIPLGGNRRGSFRRYLNVMITMLLGGLWHGAGWTFVVWGGLHGLYLMVNHAWRSLKQRMGWIGRGRWGNFGAGALTFLAVVVGWVFFRAENFSTAVDLLRGMVGLNGVTFAKGLGNTNFASSMRNCGAEFLGAMHLTNLDAFKAIRILVPGLFVVFMLPNVQQIMANYESVLDAPKKSSEKHTGLVWQSSLFGTFVILMIGFLVIINLHKQSIFLYFQF